jgi:hypothetical protein
LRFPRPLFGKRAHDELFGPTPLTAEILKCRRAVDSACALGVLPTLPLSTRIACTRRRLADPH